MNYKSKNKGFTLVELLGVVVIIALLSIIVMPKITERFNEKQKEAFEISKEVLYSATREYISSNQNDFDTGDDYYCVRIDDLIKDGKLVEPVIDSNTGSEIPGYVAIEVTKKNNQYGFEYNSGRCSMHIETIPSADKTRLTLRVISNINSVNLHSQAYSFDNGATWQNSNEKTISSYYSNNILVRSKSGYMLSLNFSIGKITINANGGIWNSLSGTGIVWLEKNKTANIIDPIKLGYDFKYWNGVTGGSSINGRLLKMGDSDITITAVWDYTTYSIEYVLDDGTLTTPNPTTYRMDTTTFTLNNPQRTYSDFLGWSGPGIEGTSFSVTIPKGSTGNRTYIANWTKRAYLLTIDTDGGTWEGAIPNYELLPQGYVPEYTTITIINPFRYNYAFTGWTLTGENSNLSGTAFTMGTGNATLKATWRPFSESDYIYTGSHEFIDEEGDNFKIKFLSGGKLTLNMDVKLDVFLVGGGGSGSGRYANLYGGGGGGGYSLTKREVIRLAGEYTIVIGGSGSKTTAFDYQANGGGNGGCPGGGSGGASGGNGGTQWSDSYAVWYSPGCNKGTDSTSTEFGEDNGIYYGGGGGGDGCAGGRGGGGNGGTSGAKNTGGGGGGSGASIEDGGWGGQGGSGIAIIRNYR